jgi:hypothetical protein
MVASEKARAARQMATSAASGATVTTERYEVLDWLITLVSEPSYSRPISRRRSCPDRQPPYVARRPVLRCSTDM